MIDAIPKTCSSCGRRVLEIGHLLKGSHLLSDPDDLMSEYTCVACYVERWGERFGSAVDSSDAMIPEDDEPTG